MRRNGWILIVLLLAVPAAVHAQSYRSDILPWEFTLGGSGSSDQDFDATVFSTEFSVGYFITEGLEPLIRQSIGFSDSKHSDSTWSGSTRLAVDYHFFSNEKFRPYLGAVVGYVYGDAVENTFVAGAEGGLKFFVNSTTFLNGMMAYEFFFEDTSDVDVAYDDGRFVYALSIGFRF